MTDNELRVAIAEALGWKRVQQGDAYTRLGTRCGLTFYGTDPEGYGDGSLEIPDYLNDLNAMAEAEATLTEEQQVVYARRLIGLCCGENDDALVAVRKAFHATARQRALAFVQTITQP